MKKGYLCNYVLFATDLATDSLQKKPLLFKQGNNLTALYRRAFMLFLILF